MGLFGSTFSAIGRYFSRHHPIDPYFDNYIIGQKGAVWLPTKYPHKLYEKIPQLKTVIDRRAEMFSNAELYVVDDDGKRIEGAEGRQFDDFFNRPAPEYSMNEWLANFQKQLCIYGNQYMYAPKVPMSNFPSFLRNLPPEFTTPYLTGKYLDQVDISKMIQYFQYCDTSDYKTGERKIDPRDMIYSKIADVRFPLIGRSPVIALCYPASNIEAAYENLNVISRNRGALGILTNQGNKDAAGSVPMNPDQASNIKKDYGRIHNKGRLAGTNEADIIVTAANVKWQAMSYPTKDLLLREQISDNMITIADAFGVSINIFGAKDATYENVHKGLVSTYENTIQPAADSLAQTLEEGIYKRYGIKNRHIRLSYEHQPALKLEKRESLKSIESLVNALSKGVEAQIWSATDARTMLENELRSIGSIE